MSASLTLHVRGVDYARGKLRARDMLTEPFRPAAEHTVASTQGSRFSNRLLVGNFGDGTIQAFDVASGRRVGALRTPQGKRLAIPVLWGMAFGNGILNQPTNVLFFAAGPNFGTGGLYGRISPAEVQFGTSDADDDN